MPPSTLGRVEQTVNRLVEYIATNNIASGERLPPIRRLARELDLAPTAVREALLRAQAIGLVCVQPRSGVVVQTAGLAPRLPVVPPSEAAASLFDILEARRVVESELTQMAAARRRMADMVPLRDTLLRMYAPDCEYAEYIRLNEEFHVRIARVAGNRVLLVVLEQLIAMMRGVLAERQPADWVRDGSRKRAADRREHEAVYLALLAGDGPAAKAAMLEHLRDTTETLMPGSAPPQD